MLVGFPLEEVLVKYTNKEGQPKQRWCPVKLLKTVPQNAQITNEVRMGYASPSWLPKEENPNGTILLLDDYTRASQLFMQATMELINEGKYISWSLPKNTSIILTSNPDNGQFQVSSLDTAQKTRMINFNLRLNVEDWAAWAEFHNIDSRCINFCLSYGDKLFCEHNGIKTINPRSYTTFCKAIRGVKNWESEDSLTFINLVSKGCFIGDDGTYIGNLFSQFVHNKLDKLISPKDILLGSWETVKQKMESAIYDGDRYRCDIGSILATRLLNYTCYYLEQSGSKGKTVEDRLMQMIHNPKMLLSEDLLYNIMKTIVSKYPSKTNNFLLNAELRNKIIQ